MDVGRYDYKDAYTEVGGRATQDAKAEVIGTTLGKEEVELRREQQPRVESGTETESNAGAVAEMHECRGYTTAWMQEVEYQK